MTDKKKPDGMMIIAICLGIVTILCIAAVVGLMLYTRPAKLSQAKMQENMAAADAARKSAAEQPVSEEEAENHSKEIASFDVSSAGSNKKADAKGTKKNDSKKDDAKEDDADAAAGESEYLCSYSAERLVTEEDVAALNAAAPADLPAGKGMIQMVINEMYAKHGYQFETPEIQAYFDQKAWYQNINTRNPDMSAVFNGMSDVEKRNVEFLNAHNEEVG